MAVQTVQNPGEAAQAAASSACCHCHHELSFYEEVFPDFREFLSRASSTGTNFRQALEERLSLEHSHDK